VPEDSKLAIGEIFGPVLCNSYKQWFDLNRCDEALENAGGSDSVGEFKLVRVGRVCLFEQH
jgi:hypothetical protein